MYLDFIDQLAIIKVFKAQKINITYECLSYDVYGRLQKFATT